MKKKQETGYAKNYANLEDLISVCKEFGPTYNPKKECLTINGLINTHEAAAEIMKETRDSKVNRDLFTINRSKGYAAMKHLMIRAAHAFEVSGAGKELVADAKGILRKINGRRAVPIKTNDNGKPQSAEPPSAEIPAATGTTGVETKTISVSQQGYDDMMGHFEKMLALVSSNSSFEANEAELKFEALQKSMEELKAICSAYASSFSKCDTAMIKQYELFYHPDNGLVANAQDVKTYVKAVFGAKSKEYKRVSKITFTRR